MNIRYDKVADALESVVCDGGLSSKTTPRLIDILEERNGGWTGAAGDIPTLHKLLVALLYAQVYVNIDWRYAWTLALQLKRLQDDEEAEAPTEAYRAGSR